MPNSLMLRKQRYSTRLSPRTFCTLARPFSPYGKGRSWTAADPGHGFGRVLEANRATAASAGSLADESRLRPPEQRTCVLTPADVVRDDTLTAGRKRKPADGLIAASMGFPRKHTDGHQWFS